MLGILIPIVLAIFIGFALIFLLAVSDKKRAVLNDSPTEKKISPLEFEKSCIHLIEHMKMDIDSVERTEDGLDMMVRNPTPFTGGSFIVHCQYLENPAEVIPASEIIELSNLVIQERLSKGIFMTTGQFTSDIPGIGELAPMEFIDGKSLTLLLEKYRGI